MSKNKKDSKKQPKVEPPKEIEPIVPLEVESLSIANESYILPEKIQDDEKSLLDQSILLNESQTQKQVKARLNAQNLNKYLEATGIHLAFKVIFAEIMAKEMKKDKALSYTCDRLREIGHELSRVQLKAKHKISKQHNNSTVEKECFSQMQQPQQKKGAEEKELNTSQKFIQKELNISQKLIEVQPIAPQSGSTSPKKAVAPPKKK